MKIETKELVMLIGGLILLGIIFFVGRSSKKDKFGILNVDTDHGYFPELPNEKVVAFAERLNKAMRGWGTDEKEVYYIIENVKTKNGLVQLVSYYNGHYGGDIMAQINDELNDDELTILGGILNKLS